jgi:hypothetical protein
MDIFFLIFFLIVGVAGIIFGSDIGVFVGMGLIPWQVIKLRLSKKLNLVSIILSTCAGVIYFVFIRNWLMVFLLLFIAAYNYWGHLNTKIEKEEDLQNLNNG